jgi:2-keto-4-pentenoate hydratase/2-oxohepta-3-ene-1,7-dioic acid hydratase in catechol pathway
MLSAANPRILCVGVNYRPHIEEMGREVPDYPVVFTRFASSLVRRVSSATVRPWFGRACRSNMISRANWPS